MLGGPLPGPSSPAPVETMAATSNGVTRSCGRYEFANGSRRRRVEVIGDPLRDADGQMLGVVITMRPLRRGRGTSGNARR